MPGFPAGISCVLRGFPGEVELFERVKAVESPDKDFRQRIRQSECPL
jgi:hypothetical protein